MGTDFWNMHHYCYALRDMLRLRIRVLSPADRVYLRWRAINDIGYVIKTCRPTMPLMPEVYLSLGQLYLMSDDLAEASEAFEQSRTLKPDYWPAYDLWINELIRLRQYQRARELTEAGLKYSPKQPALVARLREIDAALAAGNHGSAASGSTGGRRSASAPR